MPAASMMFDMSSKIGMATRARSNSYFIPHIQIRLESRDPYVLRLRADPRGARTKLQDHGSLSSTCSTFPSESTPTPLDP